MFRRLSMLRGLPLVLAALPACSGNFDGSDPERLDTSQQEIIGGTTVTTDNVGTPRVSSPAGGCSGTMLRRQWLLTAGHCVTTNGAIGGPSATPSSVSAQLLNGSNAPVGTGIWRHPTSDVALVRLNATPLNAAGQPVSNRLYPGDVAGLVSQSLPVQGWGNNTITSCNPFGGAGFGVLRTGNITLSSVTSTGFTSVPNAGVIQWTGDSGSAMLGSIGGFLRPVGVESTGTCTSSPLAVTSIGHVRGDYFRAWANGIIGTAPAAGTPAAFERADAVSVIIYPHFQTNRIRELSLTSSWQVNDLNTAAGSSVLASSEVSAYVRNDSASAIVFRGTDGHVRELALKNGWVATDVSGAGAAVASGSRPAAYVRSDAISTVVYRASDNHIREQNRNSNGTWTNADLTAITSAPLAAGDPIGYVRADGINAVVYKSSTGRVIELALVNGQWISSDLSAVTGGTGASSLVAFGPRPFTRSDGVTSVIYVDVSNRIQELTLPVGGSWSLTNFSGLTGSSTNVAVPFTRSDDINTIVYINSDGHVREAALVNGTWVTNDLSGLVGAPNALNPAGGAGSIPSGYVRGDNITTIVYQAADHHVIELHLVNGTWGFSDLSSVAGNL